MNRSLEGRNILITGGAGLLGVEHAVAVMEAGGVPILTDINATRLEQAAKAVRQRAGAAPMLRPCDITSQEELTALKTDLDIAAGFIDGLVNNAAVNPPMSSLGGKSGAFETFPLESWNAELAVGLTGAMLCTQVFGAAMAERGSGAIVNIASDLAIFAPDHRIYVASRRMEDVTNFKPVSYSVTKTALIGLTKYVATYWAHRGVRCNALAPGGVHTGQPDVLVEGLKERTPLRRMARADEYHGALVFLLSDASAYMTGQTLVMDGGRSVW